MVPGFDAAMEAVDLTGVAGLDQLLGRHAATHAAGTVDDELLTVVVRDRARVEGRERDQGRAFDPRHLIFVGFAHVDQDGVARRHPGL